MSKQSVRISFVALAVIALGGLAWSVIANQADADRPQTVVATAGNTPCAAKTACSASKTVAVAASSPCDACPIAAAKVASKDCDVCPIAAAKVASKNHNACPIAAAKVASKD